MNGRHPTQEVKKMIDVHVHETGTRDGLQSVPFFVPTDVKKRWCSAEARAGVPEIEVCSFVPVKLLPQFADAAEVVAHALTLEGLTVAALAPNLKGTERAIELGVHKVNFVLSVSESHNRANVRRSTAESVNEFARIVELARSLPEGRRPKNVAGLSTALGCTIEGDVPEARVREIAMQLVAAGADELIVCDTVGYANPTVVRRLFRAIRSDVGAIPIKAHFHDTRGLGLANVLAALDADIRAFDASLGGLGGCPYAPGASGNICTEDLVFMLESMGLKTGVDLEKLIALRAEIQEALKGEPFHGTIAKAGLPKGFLRAA
jgi:hydroxymethylglutaryl-CoA lyase